MLDKETDFTHMFILSVFNIHMRSQYVAYFVHSFIVYKIFIGQLVFFLILQKLILLFYLPVPVYNTIVKYVPKAVKVYVPKEKIVEVPVHHHTEKVIEVPVPGPASKSSHLFSWDSGFRGSLL